jgi:hypothetical protein
MLNPVDMSQDLVYQVHWLRTKALCDRWAEEMLLVGHEMQWTVDFLAHKAQTWLD